MEKEKCIVFVAGMRNPNKDASSTQIMTSNLLQGFREICNKLLFIPVIENEADKADIVDFYKRYCDDILFLKQNTKYEKHVFLRQLSMLKESFFPRKYLIDDTIDSYLNQDTIIVSQSPKIDAISICRQLQKKHPGMRYIQYWGDPMALSGITVEHYNFKRFILKHVERREHQFADKIVFGTETLYREQLRLFPEIERLTTYCDVAYNPQSCDSNCADNEYLCGYFGNYYSGIRNIKPLYNAFKSISSCKLVICGSSDLNLSNTDNVIVKKRIPQSQVEKEEAKTNVEICVLNHACAQIPGKLFYHTNTNKPILVVLDGPRAETIRKELERSRRFAFCDNNEKSICKAIETIISCDKKDFLEERMYYNPARICSQIINE